MLKPPNPTMTRKTSRSDARLLERARPHRADAGTYDVVQRELDHGHWQAFFTDEIEHGAQARGFRQIALTDVAVDDDRAVLADARQERLDLGGRGVLRLVEQDESVAPRAPAHHLERDHLDVAPLQRDVEGGG